MDGFLDETLPKLGESSSLDPIPVMPEVLTMECKQEDPKMIVLEETSFLQTLSDNENCMTNSCRICMGMGLQMSPIFTEDNKVSVHLKIMYCTGLQIKEDDGKPKQICIKCLTNLSLAHDFKTIALNSDEAFQKLLKINIKKEKEELTDSDNDVDSGFDLPLVKSTKSQTKVKSKKQTAKKNKINVKIKGPKEKKSRAPKSKTQKAEDGTQKSITKEAKSENTEQLNGKVRRTLHCTRCDISFETRSLMVAHTRKEHATERYMCEHCGKIFKYPSSHQSHLLTHLPPGFPCTLCSYSAYTKCDLQKHMRTHSGEKNLKCPHCPKMCSVQSNLNAHIRNVHLGERSHKCHLCDKAYYDKSHLTRHLDSHNDIRRYACQICKTAYRRRRGMIKHVLKIHGIVVPTPRPGRPKAALLLQIPDTDVPTHQ